ncbi:unnamed protein product [Nyctereutes procyonoides]|uniref:(raccoon dog) hypothetical protein n=1 Tax=Nyctereutes procyonoides TaxID=34880 RepID=A0A811ZRP4_NYCPR|nr:unnamed protein product [Nyctereutes procyonoides]
MLYWPLSTSDLYNWKTQNAKFSDNPRDLIGLLDTVLFTHLATWDDCQQLLQVLFTTEERGRIQVEARKSVLGEGRQPTQNPDLINAERLQVYRQTLTAGLKAAACKPTNLAKVYDVRQGKDESPAAFLERVIEAFRQYTPMNPEARETKAAIIMAFVNQAAPDIKKKLQSVERLGEKSLQDLVIVAERVYNNRERPEEQQTKLSDRQTQNLAKILLATTMDDPQERRHLKKLASGTGKEDGPGPPRERPKLNKNQCAYCKEEGHWVKSCPNKRSKVTQGVALVLGADWKLDCAYRSQSSGQVERMNRTLKETLTKLALETGGDWVTLLPFALYRVRNSPYKMGLTPYEIMFGLPPPIIPNLKPEVLAEFDDHQLPFSLQMLQRTHEKVWPKLRALYETGPPPDPHRYRPGDWVYV